MSRAVLVWGGAAAAILGLGALAFGAVVATATPAAHVQRYLDALATDDLVGAARLAGLEPPTAMPLGDEGAPSIHRIVSSTPGPDGTVTVVAEYGDDTDAVRVPFMLVAAPPTLGLVPAWVFAQPPVVALSVAADQHDVLVVGDRRVQAESSAEPVLVSAFVPARVTVRLDEPLLRAAPSSLRAVVDAPPAVLVVEATERFERAVTEQVEALMSTCAEQQVLQPSGCPFGIEIDDRVIGRPSWRVIDSPALTLGTSERPGVWRWRGTGTAAITVTVQRLFDGRTSERDDEVEFIVSGEVVLGPDGPVLTVYPPD
ncbi:hypothetical protein [Microcella sp.]|uniref:hypothetical protein n=1 Tax=Microcella sp. TaxID=1913979 RepID=UPI00391C7E12